MRSVTNKTAKGFYGAGVVLAYVLGGWNSSPYNVADFLCSFRQASLFFPIEMAYNGISCLSQ